MKKKLTTRISIDLNETEISFVESLMSDMLGGTKPTPAQISAFVKWMALTPLRIAATSRGSLSDDEPPTTRIPDDWPDDKPIIL